MTEKCAPSKNYRDGSCFTLESLKLIAYNYNKRYGKKIDITDNKEKLVNQLENVLKNKCSNQTCWLRQEFVKELENDDIINNTFRPVGPKNKYEWLSTSNIDDVVGQYQEKYPDFLFLGAVPLDFEDLDILGINNIDFADVEKNGKHRIGMVINLDEHYKGGSHWVALYADLEKNQVYFFDSFGKKPLKRIRNFITKIANYLYSKKYDTNLDVSVVKKDPTHSHYSKLMDGSFDVRFNKIQHQFNNSECGVYSMNFIIRLLRGETFEEITQNITKDEEMNKCRKSYFRSA
jgi:hypothetical protein